MSPEEWQALSPEQQTENALGHTHDGAAPATATAVETPTSEAAPPVADDVAVTEPRGGDAPATVAVPGVPSEQRSAPREESRQRRVTVRMPAERTTAVIPAPKSSTVPSIRPAVATEVRTPVVPVAAPEPAVSTDDRRNAKPRSSQRRSADRQPSAAQRQSSVPEPIAVPRTDAGQMSDTRVGASPTVVAPDAARVGFELWVAFAAVLAALGALVAFGRGRPDADATVTAGTDSPPPVDPVEAELQAIIACRQSQCRTEAGVPSGAQDGRA